METQERVEREINLMELFWNLLLGWRQIICFGILFALLAGGLKYFTSARSYQALQNMDVEELKSNLEKEELEKISDAEQIQIRIDDYQKYLEESAMMQMNPYEKPVLEMQYYIESDYIINYTKDSKRDYTEEVASMYCNYINSGDMAQKVIEQAGLSVTKGDFRELVQVSQTSGTLFISVSYADIDKLEDISNAIKSLLEQKSEQLQKIGAHKLEIINESQNVIVDSILVDKKSNMAASISSLKTQLQTLKSGFSTQQSAIFDTDMEELRGEKETEEAPGFSIKFLILGAMAGIFLACAWIACRMLFTVRLQSSEDIRSIYGIRLFGEVEVSSEKKRFLSVIDKKILSVKNRRKKCLSVEKQIKVVCANIALSCRQQEIECIYMTGSEYEKIDIAVLEKIKKELSVQKIKVKEGESIMYDAASLQAGIEIGHLLFVEQKGQSIYDEIFNEVNLAKEQKGDILGAVVLV